jgi:hypothetical protein
MSAALPEHAAPVVTVHPVNATCCICCAAKQEHPTKVAAKAMTRSVHQTAFEKLLNGNFFAAEPLKFSLPRTPFAVQNAVAWLM